MKVTPLQTEISSLDRAEKTYLIRPVRLSDATDLLNLVKLSQGGLSSLQPRLDYLKTYIKNSEESFSGKKAVGTPHKYLLGLYEIKNEGLIGNTLIGCAAVKTCIGLESPFINFDIQGDGLDEYLIASSRYTGATEVGSLFLHPDYRAEGLGRYLAKVRYMLIATEPWQFGETIIAELRGICGPEGSPLYDYMFKDKLELSFLDADAQYYDRDPNALGDIVPIGKIATTDLPANVRASIGHPHQTGISAMRLLQSEGFIFSGTIDLFDAGPIMSVYRDTIRTVMSSQTGQVKISDDLSNGYTSLIAAGGLSDFRAIVTTANPVGTELVMTSEAQNALQVKEGESLRFWQSPKKIDHLKREIPYTKKARAHV